MSVYSEPNDMSMLSMETKENIQPVDRLMEESLKLLQEKQDLEIELMRKESLARLTRLNMVDLLKRKIEVQQLRKSIIDMQKENL